MTNTDNLAALAAAVEAGEDELVLPPTLEETKAAMSALIGDITEARTWIKLQYEAKANGLWLDRRAIAEKQREIAELQGDIEALKKHAAGFHAAEQLRLMEAAREKKRLTAANLERQAQIVKEAQAAKNDRRVAAAELQARKMSSAKTAIVDYIKEYAPEHLQAVYAVSDAAQRATK